MRTPSQSRARLYPKILIAILTALSVAAPAVTYNVQAAVAVPVPGTLGTWIAVSDGFEVVGDRHLLLSAYFSKVSGVDLSVAPGTVRALGEAVCDPASAWWCLEEIE
jgi:hypothetical protein